MSKIKVKHFGVILLHYITFCAALYFTTCKRHLSSLIYHVWQHGIGFFFSNNACLPLNKHRSPADLTQYLFQYLRMPLVNSVKHLNAFWEVVGSILLRPD